jgi:hypothetical protein
LPTCINCTEVTVIHLVYPRPIAHRRRPHHPHRCPYHPHHLPSRLLSTSPAIPMPVSLLHPPPSPHISHHSPRTSLSRRPPSPSTSPASPFMSPVLPSHVTRRPNSHGTVYIRALDSSCCYCPLHGCACSASSTLCLCWMISSGGLYYGIDVAYPACCVRTRIRTRCLFLACCVQVMSRLRFASSASHRVNSA